MSLMDFATYFGSRRPHRQAEEIESAPLLCDRLQLERGCIVHLYFLSRNNSNNEEEEGEEGKQEQEEAEQLPQQRFN